MTIRLITVEPKPTFALSSGSRSENCAVGMVIPWEDGDLMSEDETALAYSMLKPFVRFKRKQVALMLEALAKLKSEQTPEKFLDICRLADCLAEANYASQRKHTAATVEAAFRKKGLLSP